MSKNLDAMFAPENFSAREKVTEWVNIKEKIGTRCGGKFLGYWEKPAEGKFKRSISVALQDFEDPKLVYGVTIPEYYEKDVMRFLGNDEVGIEYYKDSPAKEKGMSPTKVLRLINLTLNTRIKNGTAAPIVQATKDTTPAAETETVDADDDLPF